MHVVLVSSVSLTGGTTARATGIGIYVKELSKRLIDNSIDVTLVTGTAASSTGKSTGTDERIRVIPVASRSVRSNLGFMMKLLFKMPSIKLDKSAIIHAQRPELLLPFTLFRRSNPRICTLHGSPYKSVSMKHGSLYTGIYRRIEGFCLKRAHVIISVDKYTRNEYKERYPYLADALGVIPTGLDLGKFKLKPVKKLRTEYELPASAPVIIYAGRLEPEKRLELLLQAFAELSGKYAAEQEQPHLLLCGDGHQRSKLEAMAKDLKLKNVRFQGAVPHDSMPDVLNMGDAFVLISAFEGSPTVVKEALACGLPVVATKVGNLAELISAGENGEIVPVDATPAEIADRLKQVLDARRSGEITREACAKSVTGFGWDKIAKKIVGMYNEVR
jgi:glycosyltransferase involved in cell wall biosynthesis